MLYTPKERQVKKMKGVIYARYSSDNQREKSIEGQLRECKAFAEKNDIQIVETYIDRGFSVRTERRPDFQRMIKDSEKNMFDVVLVWKLDRFARNRYDSAHYKSILQLKSFHKVQKAFCLNLYLRVMSNTTLPSFPKRSFVV